MQRIWCKVLTNPRRLIDSICGAAGALVSPVLMFGDPFEGLIISAGRRGVRGGVRERMSGAS